MRIDRTRSLVSFLSVIVVAVASLACIAVALFYLGFGQTTTTLISASFALAIGLGLQPLATHWIAGLILWIERPIEPGTYLVLGQHQGLVRAIHLRTTEIETPDETIIQIPNADILANAVRTASSPDQQTMITVTFGLSRAGDLDAATDIIRATAIADPQIRKTPPPTVHFEAFGPDTANFVLTAYARDVSMLQNAKTALVISVLNNLREDGIELQLPQHDITLRDLEPFRQAFQAARAQQQAKQAD